MEEYDLPERRTGCYRSKVIVALILSAILLFIPSCGSVPRTSAQLTPDEVEVWVSYLASDEMQGRVNGSEQMKEAANWIAERFDQFGLHKPPGQESYFQEYTFHHRDGNSVAERNVVGYIEGHDRCLKDQYIVISAHFDHIGKTWPIKGDAICNGADDNASGIAALLGIVRNLKQMKAKTGR